MRPAQSQAQALSSRDPRLFSVSLAFRSFRRDFALSPFWAYAVFGVAPVLVAALLGVGLYLVFRDDMLTALMRRQAQMQFAYEDRIAALRDQVDMMASRQMANQDTVEGKVAELAVRQARLESRSALVTALAARVAPNDGLSTLPHAPPMAAPVRQVADPAKAVTGKAPQDGKPPQEAKEGKPAPEGFDLRRGAGGSSVGEDLSDASDSLTPAERLRKLSQTFERIERKQVAALENLRAPATARAEHLRLAFAEAGLPLERLLRHAGASLPQETPDQRRDAVGGPYEPAEGLSDFDRAYARLNQSVTLMDGLRRALPFAPLRQPLSGALDVTSVFGYRTDPFFGRPALHSGMDLRADMGAPVRATASGRVTVAEPSGGYGNMVEVDHGAGLATRYGHLSEIDVQDGQWVEAGTLIGRVGSTGRSTGPHLHYEVRIDGVAVDPSRYLKAGHLLNAGL
jgi:murein DD-endopeptidase MepM/ murein hydrolase activator NlpD